MHKGKKFPERSKYGRRFKRKSRIKTRNQGTWFDKETGKKPGTHVKLWKKKGMFNKYGRSY